MIYVCCVNASYIKKTSVYVTPTFVGSHGQDMHLTALGSARRTRRLPDNWLSSQLVIFARARQRGVGADDWRKLHYEHGESG